MLHTEIRNKFVQYVTDLEFGDMMVGHFLVEGILPTVISDGQAHPVNKDWSFYNPPHCLLKRD